MHDQQVFLRTLSRFAAVLPARYELEVALSELTESVTAVLRLCGSGITMADDGRLRFVTTVTLAAGELERDHALQHPCPCRDAYSSGEVVLITDLRQEPIRWPEFSATATSLGVAAVAGIPMRLADQIVGSLNLYSTEPRQWSDEDIEVARVLANVATSYVVNASKLRQLEQLSEQLKMALGSRVIIEQAKGMTAQQQGVSVDQAFQLMRGHARRNSASLRTVAEAIVAVGLRVGSSGPVRSADSPKAARV